MEKIKSKNRFYVYVYLDTRKPGEYIYGEFSFKYEPFYIGKGTGYRNKTHITEANYIKENCIKAENGDEINWFKINKILKIIKETGKNPKIFKIEENLLEKHSLKLERKCIKVIGRHDLKKGPLTNLTDGGEGQSRYIVSKETREKISKSESGENHYFFGKKHTNESKQKMRDSHLGEKSYNFGVPMTEKNKKALFEVHASIYYWKNIFKENIDNFKRDKDGSSPNNFLNYGYSILRSIMAKSIVASGLSPTIGIFHKNQFNAFCLADDLMEPFRPFVDKIVFDMIKQNGVNEFLNKEHKKMLLQITSIEVMSKNEKTSLTVAIQNLINSYAKVLNKEQEELGFPEFLK